MAKPRATSGAPSPPLSNSPTPVVVVGAIIVITLVAFSFSRTMQNPASPAPAATAPQAAALPSAAEAQASNAQDNAAPLLPPVISPRGEVPLAAAPTIPDIAPTQAELAAAPRIEAVDLFQRLENKQVTLIDVRDVDSYRTRHIPGAMQIPLSFIAGEVPYLPKDKPIVTYCT